MHKSVYLLPALFQERFKGVKWEDKCIKIVLIFYTRFPLYSIWQIKKRFFSTNAEVRSKAKP